MGDATKNLNNNRILEAFQRSGKRKQDDVIDDRRQRPRHQEENITGENSDDQATPTASGNNLNNNNNNNFFTTDVSDSEVSEIDSNASLPTIRINDRSREDSRETVVETETRNNFQDW